MTIGMGATGMMVTVTENGIGAQSMDKTVDISQHANAKWNWWYDHWQDWRRFSEQ